MTLTLIYVVSFGSWQFIVEDHNDQPLALGKDYPCSNTAIKAARNATGRQHLTPSETQEIY